MSGLKAVVVGGASTYTPELVTGLAARQEELPVAELVLLDPDRDRLEVVAAFAARILDATGWRGRLTATSNRELALDAADAVLLQLRVGGQQARLHDETVPLACGCLGQETTGAGGLAKALRTVPVVLDLAEEVRRRAAPDAWIVDFTNPVGIVTRALRDAGHRAVGLCNVAIGLQRTIARMLDVTPERVLVDQVGLNHLTWIRRVLLDGADVLPELLDRHGAALADHVELPVEVLRELGAIPSYYLRYYYAHDAVLAEQRDGVPRAAQVRAIEEELLRLYRDPGLVATPPLLEQRGGAYYSEAAVALLTSLVTGDGAVHEVDVPNAGTLPGLADDDVVEVPARVDRAGPHPLPQPPLAPELLGLVQHVAAYERLAVRAALSGDAADVRRALLAHPLVGQWDVAVELARTLPHALVPR
ncbi:MAG TPA: 6-phospho-beta-glucosidase [Kineosporiaceae bacterium]|nr:6-phospho-beta-glucosidase [Kineosporiaceae bacterium]